MLKIFENLHRLFKIGKEEAPSSSRGGSLLSHEELCSMIEDLLCFERAIRFCYASMDMLIHNRTIRHQCQNFYRWSHTNEQELDKISETVCLLDSSVRINQPYTLPSEELTVESVVSLGLVITEHRLEGYKDLRKQVIVRNRIILNQIMGHITEEIKFFKREKEMLSLRNVVSSLR